MGDSSKSSKPDEGMFHLHSSDHPGMALTATVLDGRNYWAWSIGIKTALEAKDKSGFIDDISDSFVFCTSSKALWNTLEERYGVDNTPQLYHIQRHVSSMAQGADTVTVYFNKINRCWDEMGRLMPLPTCVCGKCTCNLKKKVADLDDTLKLM
ncbi:uncharacterized protein G2W53_018602 [Senna tora]|uniref:Retrotransposon Copia-like N-terminal domain-containing protein n=1 Tax=Senna tora TaxID=362788 RepID=A0A834TSB9_9FABA|nr:uncharacterized protein G2W53_018602 [Senna tora]